MGASPIPTRFVLVLALTALGCRAAADDPGPPASLSYVGSSTVGEFIALADAAYAPATFTMDTAPESEGGEQALLDGHADLAGVAREPRPEVLAAGVRATLIGRDAVAVIVHPELPVRDLSREQLAGIFGGEVDAWSALGGPELAVRPFVMGPESATRGVFRRAVLGEADYAGCEVVNPDGAMIELVASTPGAIGTISLSFLVGEVRVRAIAVDGMSPELTNFAYPITRPLYLLWREELSAVEDFVDWARGREGQKVVMRRFVGAGVVGAVGATTSAARKGTLVVFTPREEVYDGGVFYHPYRGYELRTRYGDLIRRVPNRVGKNDEHPTRVDLDPGVYLVRAPGPGNRAFEFFATIEAGRTTELDVLRLLEERP